MEVSDAEGNLENEKKKGEEEKLDIAEKKKNLEEKKDEEQINSNEIILTASEEELGIKIIQPNQEIINSMERLHAVPSEKVRVWICCLTKVGERAEEWQKFLKSHIDLTLRIFRLLQKVRNCTKKDKKTNGRDSEGKKNTKNDLEEIDDGVIIERKSDGWEAEENDEEVEDEKGEVKNGDEDVEVEGGARGSSAQKEEDVEEEDAQLVEKTPEDTEKSSAGRGGPDEEGGEGREEEGQEHEMGQNDGKGEEEEEIEFKEGFWPIGTRWKPRQINSKLTAESNKLKEIPIPTNEEAMLRLIKEVRHQTVLYRSLYKHWQETGDQAIREIVGRTVMPTQLVHLSGEDVPYFFHLGVEPEVDFAIEHDDEEVFLPDLTREKISHGFGHLYFNLADKPGKGGKPWM